MTSHIYDVRHWMIRQVTEPLLRPLVLYWRFTVFTLNKNLTKLNVGLFSVLPFELSCKAFPYLCQRLTLNSKHMSSTTTLETIKYGRC